MKKLVIGLTSPGSVPLIKGQAKYFVEKGYEVYLMCPEEERSIKYCKDEGCKLLPVPIERYISPLSDIKSLILITKVLNEIKPDIVNVGTPKMGFLGMIGAWFNKVPKRIYTCRGLRYEHEKGLFKKFLRFIEKIPGILSHYIICISPSVEHKALKEKVFNPKKTIVISKGSSNGLDLSKFSIDKVDESERNKLIKKYSADSNFIYTFVGRIIDRKGINELYEAFDAINKKYRDTRLIFVGNFDKKQLRDVDIIRKLKNHDNIHLAGWQDNVPLFFSISDVFVMPAWWEGFGNSYIEAAAMGVPIIGTNGTGCIDAVNDGFNGIIVNVKSIEELKKAMNVYYENKEILIEHGENGIRWAKNFENEIIWNGLQKLYEK
ncbi:MAG: glycosyltransferase family 4 protein [Balneolaceae bacterium]